MNYTDQEISTALKQLDNIRDVADVVSEHLGVNDKDKPLDDRIHAQMTGLIASLESQKREVARLATAQVEVKECGRNAALYSLDGLKHALLLVAGCRALNRTKDYLAALDDVEIFLAAAVERVERGEPMQSTAITQ